MDYYFIARLVVTLIIIVISGYMGYRQVVQTMHLRDVENAERLIKELRRRTPVLAPGVWHGPPVKPKRTGPPFIYVGLYEEELAEDEQKSVIQ